MLTPHPSFISLKPTKNNSIPTTSISMAMPGLLPIALIFTTACVTLSIVHADDTTTTALTKPRTSTTVYQKLNSSSSCFPFVLRMTFCLDFLVTGSLVPTPSDQCCLRLKWTGELDFPCLCDLLAGNRGWGRKVNHTRAENLPLSCGLFSSNDNSLKFCGVKMNMDAAQHAPTPKSAIFKDVPRLAETHDHEHAEVPEPSTAKLTSNARRLLSDTIVPRNAFPVTVALLSFLP